MVSMILDNIYIIRAKISRFIQKIKKELVNSFLIVDIDLINLCLRLKIE